MPDVCQSRNQPSFTQQATSQGTRIPCDWIYSVAAQSATNLTSKGAHFHDHLLQRPAVTLLQSFSGLSSILLQCEIVCDHGVHAVAGTIGAPSAAQHPLRFIHSLFLDLHSECTGCHSPKKTSRKACQPPACHPVSCGSLQCKKDSAPDSFDLFDSDTSSHQIK